MDLVFQGAGGGGQAGQQGKGGDGSASKRRGVTSKTEKEEQERVSQLTDLIAKLVLSNSLSCRVLRAIVIRCYKLQTNSKYIVLFKEAKAKYIEDQSTAKAQGHSNEAFKNEVGIPSVWGTNALFKHLINLIKEDLEKIQKMSKEDQESKKEEYNKLGNQLKSFETATNTWIQVGGWKLVHKAVPHAVVSKMFQNSEKRLEMSCPLLGQVRMNPDQYMIQHAGQAVFRPEHLMIALHERLCKDGSEMLGIAPPGDLERKIQAHLDEMK